MLHGRMFFCVVCELSKGRPPRNSADIETMSDAMSSDAVQLPWPHKRTLPLPPRLGRHVVDGQRRSHDLGQRGQDLGRRGPVSDLCRWCHDSVAAANTANKYDRRGKANLGFKGDLLETDQTYICHSIEYSTVQRKYFSFCQLSLSQSCYNTMKNVNATLQVKPIQWSGCDFITEMLLHLRARATLKNGRQRIC